MAVCGDYTKYTNGGCRCEKCKQARSAYHKKYYAKHRETIKAKRRAYYEKKGRDEHRRRNYNISPEEYAELLKKQNGACALCLTVPDLLHVDHCHESGEVRGLLCVMCNWAIGAFKEDTDAMRRAIDYLGGNS